MAGLPCCLELVGEHVFLARDHRRIEAGGIDRLRIRGRDMHGDHAAERGKFVGLAGRFERDQHADLAETVGHRIVHIGADRALADRERGGAAQRHVLADLGDRVGDRLGNRDAAGLGGLDLLDVGADVERHIGDHLHQALEQIVARDEIGLRIDFDQRRPWCPAP